MKVLSKRQILMLHSMLMEHSGGMNGLRDEGLLDSAIHLPLQTFGGQELYPTILEKAARLGYGLIHNPLWMAISALAPMPCWYFWTSTMLWCPMKMKT